MNTTIDLTGSSLSKFFLFSNLKTVFLVFLLVLLSHPLSFFAVPRQKLHIKVVHLHFLHHLNLVMKLTILKYTPTFIFLIYPQSPWTVGFHMYVVWNSNKSISFTFYFLIFFLLLIVALLWLYEQSIYVKILLCLSIVFIFHEGEFKI